MREFLIEPKKLTAEQIELGRHLFSKSCRFVIGCTDLEQIPDTSTIEVAFAGRSNVGKSSLINGLVNQKSLARTSNTPGRTREINFFDLGGCLMLVDLPGYGYARVSQSKVKRWTSLTNNYLKGRANLRRTLMLIDSRHNLKITDKEILKMLDKAGQSYQLVLTKCDKMRLSALDIFENKLHKMLNKHPAALPMIFRTSSRTGDGLPQLKASLAKLAL